RDLQVATAGDLGYAAGPRLNAAGRLADMSIGIRCLLAQSQVEALPLARELDRLNRERRDIEASMQEEALAEAETVQALASVEAYTLCVHRPQWHPGVVGIVASRLKDRYHRPVIVFANSGEGELRGSGRSIAGFHLRDALDLVAKRAPDTVRRFGGHAFAAGLTIPADALARFAETFESVARECLPESALSRRLESDGELGPGELTVELCAALRGQVWGQGFPPPTFDGTFDVVAQRSVGAGHAKLTLERGGERFPAIAFRTPASLPPRIRALYRPELNLWTGLPSVELVVEAYAQP
ncbi:MAG: single-stranded-DNA-specific exonuclease RecJ, partial [Betaproteobacteria bacterium]